MKSTDIIGACFLVLLLGGVGWYVYQQRPCAPLTYYIASVDPRFGVSTSTVSELAEQGAGLWNDAAGKPLLALSPVATRNAIPVSLIYDELQQTVETGNSINQAQAEDERLRAKIEADTAAYRAHQASYERARAAFVQASAQYDAQVMQVNRSGGASPAQYAQLTAQKQALERQQAALNAHVDALNAESASLKASVEAYNLRVQQTNQVVNAFNASAHEDYNAGEYRVTGGKARIEIYEYANKTQLMRVIAHELGHALAVEHVETSDSIMYPYNTSTQAVLTAEDKAALASACTFTLRDLIPARGS